MHSPIPPTTDGPDIVRPLSRKLYLQLDNSTRANRNQYIMAVLSMLMAQNVFQMIQVGFLLVRQTLEDTNMYSNYLSKQLKTTNTFVLFDLMKNFMESQFLSFIPKSFIRGYVEELVQLKEMHIIRFFLDNDECYVF